MELRNLINRLDNIEQNGSGIKNYISEGLYSTPEMKQHWKRIDENFFQGYDSYLSEVALTADQIQNIFKQAGSAGATPKDPSKLAAIVDKVLPSSQAANLEKSLPEPDAGPVQGFEQKAAAAVDALPGADSATKQSLMQWIKQGISKPETQQLILAAVGAGVGGLLSKVGPIISMIPGGGPVASAVTGAIIAGAVSVASAKLQGKDWKTAFKGAIKPALMGGAAAVVGNLATSAVGAMMGGDKAAQDAGAANKPGASLSVGQELPDGEVISALDSSNPNSGVTITRPDGSTYSVSRDSAQSMTGQAGISPQATGPVSQGASSDPAAGVSDGGGKRGNSGWDSMKGNTNADGSPMTLDQINQAKADLRAGNATDQSDNAPIRPRLPPGASLSDFSNTSGENPNADTFRKQAQDQIALNQRMQAQADAGGIGKNFDAGIAPTGPDGTPMKAVPMDEPATGRMPGETPQGINRLTGRAHVDPTHWDNMTADQQAAVTARQQQQAADAAQGTQNAKDYWANKNPNTRGLKESFAESAYVDKQATLRMWLEQEAQGHTVAGLALKPAIKEGIMDSLKGMFGGKKGAAAPAAGGGVTADALNKAWTDAGSPMDSEEVAKVLQNAGLAPDVVNKIFADLKLPAPTGKIEPKMDPEQPAAAGATAPQSGPAAGMKADEIVKSLSSFWDQVKANQDSKSSAPQVQQQIKQMGKEAGMAGQVVEGKYSTKAVGFYSTFLGKDI